jgi:hypothetical protein
MLQGVDALVVSQIEEGGLRRVRALIKLLPISYEAGPEPARYRQETVTARNAGAPPAIERLCTCSPFDLKSDPKWLVLRRGGPGPIFPKSSAHGFLSAKAQCTLATL